MDMLDEGTARAVLFKFKTGLLFGKRSHLVEYTILVMILISGKSRYIDNSTIKTLFH